MILLCLTRLNYACDCESSTPEEAVSKLQDLQKKLAALPDHERRDPACRYVGNEIKQAYNKVIGFEEAMVS